MADTNSKIDPYNVEALEKSLNDSATRVSTIWISFLIFSLYLLVAATTVEHRQLFLADPVRLPVLNIDLPLWGFFFLAPILFVIFHVYVLLQVMLLGRTAAAYNEAINRAVRSPTSNASIRQRLANTLFAQIFSGSPRERDGWLGWLLKGMAWITLAIAPVLILFAFQVAFLPYHSHLATWVHRLLILMELTAAFLLWPLILDAQRDLGWNTPRQWVFSFLLSALFIFFSLSLATFPGEAHVNLFTGQPLSSVECDRWFSEKFDRLVLPRVDVVDDEKLAKIVQATADQKLADYQGERTRNFRNRDLNCSDLSFADLRRVDLTGASLSQASLHLSALQGASLEIAQLQGAILDRAKLQGSLLFGAHLQGASLKEAQLSGATLFLAQLQGAVIDGADVQGASLFGVEAQGASFDYANLQGASLNYALLHGATLRGVRLTGASLRGTQLQGADFSSTTIVFADLSGARVWRAKGVNCEYAYANTYNLEAAFKPKLKLGPEDKSVPATPDEIEKLIERSTASVPVYLKQKTRDRMRAGLVVDPTKNDTAEINRIWRNCAESAAKREHEKFDKVSALFLRNLVCNAGNNRRYIADGIILNWLSLNPDRPAFSTQLARGLLGEDGKECAATKDLDEPTRQKLHDAISAEANASSATGSAAEKPSAQ